jgi:citrate lyase subunit beta/citryl-CoA lyase
MIGSIQAPLFLPATKLERLEKAAASGADAIVIDLEDAVAAADKDSARAAIHGISAKVPLILRVNAPGTEWHERDLIAAREIGLASVMLPKAVAGSELRRAISILDGVPIIALVESAQGVETAREIASTCGVERLAFGSIDFCADLDCAHTYEALLLARSSLVMAARLANQAAPLDGVTADARDLERTAQDARSARALGMGGKLLIHPAQVVPTLEAFRPSAEQIAWARRVIEAPEGVSLVDGEMVDAPVRLRAQRILSRSL